MLHIVFSHAIEQLLKQALMMRSTSFYGAVHAYEPEIQFGDLNNEENRQKMWMDVYQINTNEGQPEMFIESATQVESRLYKVIKNYDKIVFWVGETGADELAFLRLIVSLDPSDPSSKELQFNRFRGKLLLGDLLPERIERTLQPVPITEELMQEFHNHWEEICEQDDKLRVREAEFTFRFIDYSFYDEQLLQLISDSDEMKLVVAVGEMHVQEPQLPYYFFVWRVQQLKKAGFIVISGEEYGFRQTYLKRIIKKIEKRYERQ